MAELETRLLINGEQVAGEGAPLEVENPFTEETVASVGTADPEQLDAAIAAAREALARVGRDAGGGARRAAARGRHAAARAHRRARRGDDAGGRQAAGREPRRGRLDRGRFDYYAEIGRDSAGRVIPPIESTQLALVLKEPLGVVGCIVPWNYPLLLLAWKLAPALAAGNTLVCKPSELTPLSTLMLAPCFDHLPPGVVNLVAGGRRRRRRDRVRRRGSTASPSPARSRPGRRSREPASSAMARINLEMGGKDPFIVCSDVADRIEVAARGGAWAAFLNAGQVCTSAERFYVMEDVYDDYVNAFVDHTKSLVIGDPMQSDTDIGPMVSATQRAEGRRPGRGRRRRGRRGRRRRRRRRARSAATSSRRRSSPAPRPRPTCCARRPSARSRRSSRVKSARRGDRARQLDPLRARRQRLHRGPRRRSCAACAR